MKKNGFFKRILSVLLSLLFVSCGDMLTLSDTASLTLAFPWGNERSVSAEDITQINVTLYSLDGDILIGEKNLTASSPNASFTNLKAENVRVLVKAFKTEENGYITELGSCQEDVKLKTGFNTLQLYLNPQKIASGKGSLSNPCLNIVDFLNVLSTVANKERTTLVYVANNAFAKDTDGNSCITTAESQGYTTPFDIPAGTNAEVHFVMNTASDGETVNYIEYVADGIEYNTNQTIPYGPMIEVVAQINVKRGAKLTFFGYHSNCIDCEGSYLIPGSPISGGTTKDCLIKVEKGGCLKMQGMNFTEIQVEDGGDLTIGNAMSYGSWTSGSNTYYAINYITLNGSASLTLGDVDTATIYLDNNESAKPKITLTSSLRENTLSYFTYTSKGGTKNIGAASWGIMLSAAAPSLLTESLFSSSSIQGVDYNKYITYYAPDATEDYSFAEDGTLRKCISNIFDLPANASGKYYVKISETTSSDSNDTSSNVSETSTPLVISNDVTILPKVVTTTTTIDSEETTSVKSVALNFNYTGASSSESESTDSSPSDDSALITVKNGASLKFENFPNDDNYSVQSEDYTFGTTINNPNAKSLFLIEEGASVELPPTFSLSSSNTGLTQLFYNKGNLTVNKDTNISDTTSEENVTVPYIITATKNAKTYFAGENTYVKSLYLKDGATLTLGQNFSIPSDESQAAIELYLDNDKYTAGTKVITLEDSNKTVTTSNFSIEGAPAGTSVELKDTGLLGQSEA